MKKRLILALGYLYHISAYSQSVYMHEAQQESEESGGLNLLGLITLVILCSIIYLLKALYKDYQNNNKRKNNQIEERIRKEKIAREEEQKKLFLKSLECPNIVKIDGVKAVDLGLGDKYATPYWAVANLCASNQFECGTVYGWGKITPAEDQIIHIYSHECNSDLQMMNFDEVVDGNYKGEDEYDAATAILGNCWFTPDYDEMMDLLNNCHWELIDKFGVFGWKVVGPNNNFIFLPIQKNGDSSNYLTCSATEDDSKISLSGVGNTKYAYFLVAYSECNYVREPKVDEKRRVDLGMIRPFSYGEGKIWTCGLTELRP